jgi:MFS family permease
MDTASERVCTRTLLLSILCYAVFAGLAAISWNYWPLLIFRFLQGLG